MAVLPFFKDKPCSVQQRLAKATFLAMLPDGSRQKAFYENIPDDRWMIQSFDPKTRAVCVRHTTLHGSENLTGVILNHLSPTNSEELDTSQGNDTQIPSSATELLQFASEQTPNLVGSALNRNINRNTTRQLPAF